jgi:hypothetical protein
MSRPEKPIDWKVVDQLLMAGCLGTEIAANFDMHPDTFYNRVEQQYGMGFTAYCSEKRSKGDSLLRAKQFEKALEKDNTMLIWLGKQRLQQKEPESRDAMQITIEDWETYRKTHAALLQKEPSSENKAS